MHPTPSLALAGALLLSGALLTGCSVDSASSPSAETSDPDAITVGTLRAQPHLFTPYLYEQFLPDDVSVDIVLFDTSSDIKNAIVSGTIDFGVTGAASVISGVTEQQDVTIVASSADGGTRIVASPNIEQPHDLVGATIGYPMGATQEILLKRTLEASGIDPDADVELVNLPFSDMAAAYASGQVDAFISAETGPSIAITEGAHEVISAYDTAIGRTNIVLATRASYADEHPDTVQDLVDAHAEASEYLVAHPDEWSDGLVEEFSLEQDVVDAAIENIWPRWEIDAEYLATLDAMNTEMAEFDQIADKADPAALVDTTFVEKVD